jgi:hypothetical protein
MGNRKFLKLKMPTLVVSTILALVLIFTLASTVSADSPPILTVSGSVTYTENAAPVAVAPVLTLTGPVIDGVKVSITSNFNASQDRLGISGQSGTSGAVSGINWSYNISAGIMTLSNTASADTYQSVLRQVTYSNNSENPAFSPRTINFSIGQNTLFYAGTGHYYEYIAAPGMYWQSANSAANARTFYGLHGYLVTITSKGENDFVTSKLQGMGWMGASDAASEGTWRWVSGPESGSLLSDTYTNWASGEPNNLNDEDYGHFYTNGYWNDFYYYNNSIQGYVVEYGGVAGDTTPSLSGNVTVNIRLVNDLPTANTEAHIQSTKGPQLV